MGISSYLLIMFIYAQEVANQCVHVFAHVCFAERLWKSEFHWSGLVVSFGLWTFRIHNSRIYLVNYYYLLKECALCGQPVS